jgi:hypothetical protein
MRLAGNKVGGTVQFNYDIGRSTMLNQRYIANYNAQCCGIAFEFQTYNFPTLDPNFPVPQDRRFNFAFTLAGIGSFQLFRELRGGHRSVRGEWKLTPPPCSRRSSASEGGMGGVR